MNLKVSFTWFGLVIFALPMLINIAYVLFPPAGKAEQPAVVTHWIEIVEQISRIFQSAWLYLAAIFLILYYGVWLRYFMGGREIALLRRSFLSVPMPLAVFPVLYFLCAAIWLHNLPAAIIMMIFGAAHLTVAIQSFH